MFGFDSASGRNSRPVDYGPSLHSLGVKQPPQDAKQHEKRLSQTTCSNKPRNFSRGPGSWKPPSYVVGHCPFLELGRILEYQQGHPTPTWLLTGHGISERIVSTGTIIDRTDIPDDVMCVLKSWPTACSWLLCPWCWPRVLFGGKRWLLLRMIFFK